MTNRIRKPRNRHRRGAAVAELAICIPAILLLVLGALECCSMIFLRQSLHIAAYEGIRVAIRNDTDTSNVVSRSQRILNERSVNGSNITTTPTDTQFVARGNPISVQVTAPCEGNNTLPLQFFSGQLSATATMIKE